MANLPTYLEDPFARAGWHMLHGSDWQGQRELFWKILGEFIEGAGHQLASAGGKWSMCDEPASVHFAHDLAVAYLAALSPEDLAKIPADVHS